MCLGSRLSAGQALRQKAHQSRPNPQPDTETPMSSTPLCGSLRFSKVHIPVLTSMFLSQTLSSNPQSVTSVPVPCAQQDSTSKCKIRKLRLIQTPPRPYLESSNFQQANRALDWGYVAEVSFRPYPYRPIPQFQGAQVKAISKFLLESHADQRSYLPQILRTGGNRIFS